MRGLVPRRASQSANPILFSGGEDNVRLGCSISNHRTCGSGLWIRRYRSGISGHRQTSVFYIPCAIRNLFDFRVAGQTHTLSYNAQEGGKVTQSKVPGAGKTGSLVCFALCVFLVASSPE